MVRLTAILTECRNSHKQTQAMILLKEVVSECGTYTRDHSWVKHSKRWKEFSFGDRVSFTARIEPYLSSEGIKLGLRHIRNISKCA